MKKRLRKSAKACPRCGSLNVVPILYGYPAPEAMAAANEGKIELGGCIVGERDPRKHCKACGERFDWLRLRAPRPGERSPKPRLQR